MDRCKERQPYDLTLPASAQSRIAEQATDQAQKIIESRLDAVGVAEPLVQRHGAQSSHQILVQMPGIHDPERVKKLLSAESKLELVHVVSPPSPQSIATYNSEEEAKRITRRHPADQSPGTCLCRSK